MEWALSWKVRFQKLHLVAQDSPALEVDIFRMGRHERNGQKLHPSLFWRPARFVIVAALAGGHHISPEIESPLTEWLDMIPRKI